MLKFKRNPKLLITISLLLIFAFGLILRYKNIEEANLVFDYDQIEDQFYTYTIAVDHNLAIIGRAIYGDPRIHHGVFYYYYNLIPFLISSGNLLVSAYWNIFFNTATLFIIFILSKSMLNKLSSALISAFIVAFSFEFIKFSNWLTIDTPAIFLVPLFYLGLWFYLQKKNWGLMITFAALGLSLQSDLSFLYLIPIFLIYWLIFKPNTPNFKTLLFSSVLFLITVSTLILTEVKLNFAGVNTFLNFSTFNEQTRLSIISRLNLFSQDFFTNFSSNMLPQKIEMGIYIGLAVISVAIYQLISPKVSKQEKGAVLFMLLYLFSPAITLLIGYHDKPWFLTGLAGAIALISGYAISKLKHIFLILPILLIIGVNNTSIIINRPLEAYKLWDSIYDSTSYLANQLAVIDYTYQESDGKPFGINAVTYPLYYNGLWAYLYKFYGQKKYGYIPGWLGGDQLHPYDLLPKSLSKEKYFYLLISETGRIPGIYKNTGRKWADTAGNLIEEKTFAGFTVQKRLSN